MNYSDIEDAQDVADFLIEGLSDDTKWAIYKDLRAMGDARINETDNEPTTPDEAMGAIIWEHFYCVGYNHARALGIDE